MSTSTLNKPLKADTLVAAVSNKTLFRCLSRPNTLFSNIFGQGDLRDIIIWPAQKFWFDLWTWKAINMRTFMKSRPVKAGHFSAFNYKSVWYSFDRNFRNSEITFHYSARPKTDHFLIQNVPLLTKLAVLIWKLAFLCRSVSMVFEIFPKVVKNVCSCENTGHETLVLFPRNQTVVSRSRAWDLGDFGFDRYRSSLKVNVCLSMTMIYVLTLVWWP